MTGPSYVELVQRVRSTQRVGSTLRFDGTTSANGLARGRDPRAHASCA